jgi:hypothetical protein
MEKVLQKLDLSTAHPLYVQVAQNGEWEKMVKVQLDDTEVNTNDLLDILNPNDTLAFEVFYELDDGTHIFFGVRFGSLLKETSTPDNFLNAVVKLLQPISTMSFIDCIKYIGLKLANDSSIFLNDEVSFLELGVTDWWKSEGSKRLWNSGDDNLSSQNLKDQLSDQQQLLKSAKNYISLELAIKQPEHWLGIEVSKYTAEQYTLDMDKLLKLSNLAIT